MALTLSVALLTPGYEATTGTDEPEWPPHPARAFCALVSVADPSSADDDALRWLETQGPPEVHAAPDVGSSRWEAFVPTNITTSKGGHQTYPGRKAGARTWARTNPAAPGLQMVWPSAQPSPETLATLDALARRVAYLGRATGPALLSFSRDVESSAELLIHRPDPDGRRLLRVPYRGYLDRLRDAHDSGEAAWSVALTTGYRAPVDEVPAPPRPPHPSPYSELLVFAFRPGAGLDGRHAPVIARAFKAAVLQRLGKPRPDGDPWEPFSETDLSLVHGHHDGTRRQCAFLALPAVGGPHATGQILGVAVALSPNLDRSVRRALLQLAGLDRDDAPRLDTLRVPGIGGRLGLQAPDGRWTLRAERWSGPSQVWASVLPIVLDRFPKRRFPPEDVLAGGCLDAGLPSPAGVWISETPIPTGAPYVPRRTMARREGDILPPAIHAVLAFDGPVAGPMVVGHLRHVGLGLCVPLKEKR